MLSKSFSVCIGLVLLAACGGSGGSMTTVEPVDNGLPYAVEGATLDDFIGKSGEVTVVRHMLDYSTGVPEIVIDRAELRVTALQGEGPLVNADPNMTLVMNGEELVFVNGTAIDANGKTWSAYIDTTGIVSGTAGIYHYDYGSTSEPFDTEGVFAFGFLSDPDEIAGRTLTADYSGNWFGFGVVTDGAGAIIANEAIGGGVVRLSADFDAATISGGITGSYDGFGRVDGTIASVPWSGNGFAATFDLACGAGESCVSDTVIGGAFFGVGGSEISGAIGFDERRSTSVGTRQLVSSAGYTLTEAVAP